MKANSEKELAIIGDMRAASAQVDESDGPAEYQRRMVALAMVARTFLRMLDAQPKARVV